MKKTMEQMVINIYSNMNNVFLDDENKNPVNEIKFDDKLNEDFFIATLMAFRMQFEKLTNQEMDIIDFTHLLNKLAVQFILEKDGD